MAVHSEVGEFVDEEIKVGKCDQAGVRFVRPEMLPLEDDPVAAAIVVSRCSRGAAETAIFLVGSGDRDDGFTTLGRSM